MTPSEIAEFLHGNATNRSKPANKNDKVHPTPLDDNKIKLTSVGVMVNLMYGTYYVNCFYDDTTKAYRLDFEDEDKDQWDKFVLDIKNTVKKKNSPFSKAERVAKVIVDANIEEHEQVDNGSCKCGKPFSDDGCTPDECQESWDS